MPVYITITAPRIILVRLLIDMHAALMINEDKQKDVTSTMFNKKIIFQDIDGTLVPENFEQKVPESALDAIRQAQSNGHKVYMCSGRSKCQIFDFLWDIGLDRFIGGNGSYIEENGEVLFHKVISREDCSKAVDWMRSRNLEFYEESNN